VAILATPMAFGDGDHGCVRPAEPQVSIDADQVLNTLPVGDAEVSYFQLAVEMDAYRLASALAPSCRSIR
jgi:hypothetical protein